MSTPQGTAGISGHSVQARDLPHGCAVIEPQYGLEVAKRNVHDGAIFEAGHQTLGALWPPDYA